MPAMVLLLLMALEYERIPAGKPVAVKESLCGRLAAGDEG